MKIGILSDTHGNLRATQRVARWMLEAGAEHLFHCGDIGGEEVLAELAHLCAPQNISVYAVLGNVDLPTSDWRFFPSHIGVEVVGRFGSKRLDGKQIAWLHGDDSQRLHRTLLSREYDFVFSGHSHLFHDRKEGKTRWINPGSAGRGNPNTALLLDLSTGELEKLVLPKTNRF
jgi:putative phosphoesterase